MIAKVYSAIPQGYEGRLVEVEGDTSRSLPSFNIVGMANRTVSEARERVRSAIINSDFRFPDRRVTVNLAPAELSKDGTHLDLPIALAILVLSQQLLPGDLHNRLFAGELSLDGQTKPVRGIINIIEAALSAGFTEIYVPIDNLPQATLVPHATVIGVDSLKSLFLHLKGARPLPVYKNNYSNTNFSTQTLSTSVNSPVVKNTYSEVAQKSSTPKTANSSIVKNTQTEVTSPLPYAIVKNTYTDQSSPSHAIVENTQTDSKHCDYLLDHIRGQALAKRALLIALAGHHNLLLSGPPGSGKTLLAKTARNLLPPPSPEEQIEITKLHTLITAMPQTHERPFRTPHHTASTAAIIGGGPNALPGEISLAHRGILFLDEIPEYARPVLESLRQPLEDGNITITRAHQHATYPADFMLIATMNPCPCGYLGDPDHPCTCHPIQILNYQKRLSGPILDRIDLTIPVKKVPSQDLLTCTVKNTQTDSEHRTAQSKIITARAHQALRYRSPNKYNSSLSPTEINRFLHLSTPTQQLLQTAADKLNLSARSYFKIIKVAQTIADLDNSDLITPNHLSEALALRDHPNAHAP